MDYSSHIVFLVLCAQCVAVNIQKIEVPPLVTVGTEAVILDCQYESYNASPGLVLKWFFNGSSGLVYQWIPPHQPQVIGLLKGKVDLNFKISEEPLQAYRAIKIMKPSTDLSGNYTCVVSSFIEEDRQTKPMLVYSPGNNFNFVQEKKYVFLVTLICSAEDLYPRPEISISAQGRVKNTLRPVPFSDLPDRDTNRGVLLQILWDNTRTSYYIRDKRKPLQQAVTEMKMNSWGLYAVTIKAVVHDDDVTSPYETFTCTLSLPAANFTTNRTTIYYPGLMPTAYIAAYEVEKPQERHANGNQPPSRDAIAQLLSILIYMFEIYYIN